MITEVAHDAGAIALTLEHEYFEGLFTGNVQLLRQVFHPHTMLYGDINAQPYSKTLDAYLTAVANRVSPKDSGKPFESELIFIDVIHSIAVAKVRVKMYDFNYYDLLSFHKINDKWMIVNKLLTHVEP